VGFDLSYLETPSTGDGSPLAFEGVLPVHALKGIVSISIRKIGINLNLKVLTVINPRRAFEKSDQ
jgi:hypothetical protein